MMQTTFHATENFFISGIITIQTMCMDDYTQSPQTKKISIAIHMVKRVKLLININTLFQILKLWNLIDKSFGPQSLQISVVKSSVNL